MESVTAWVTMMAIPLHHPQDEWKPVPSQSSRESHSA